MDEWTKLRAELEALREKEAQEKARLKTPKSTRQDKLKQLRELKPPTAVTTILEDKEYSSIGDAGAASSQAGTEEEPPPPPQVFQHALRTPRCRQHQRDMILLVNKVDGSRSHRCSTPGCREVHYEPAAKQPPIQILQRKEAAPAAAAPVTPVTLDRHSRLRSVPPPRQL